jgi:hypothetical protein
VAVGPALVLLDGDHSSLAELALLDLDLADAIGGLAEGTIVGAEFCESVKTGRVVRNRRDLPMR